MNPIDLRRKLYSPWTILRSEISILIYMYVNLEYTDFILKIKFMWSDSKKFFKYFLKKKNLDTCLQKSFFLPSSKLNRFPHYRLLYSPHLNFCVFETSLLFTIILKAYVHNIWTACIQKNHLKTIQRQLIVYFSTYSFFQISVFV